MNSNGFSLRRLFTASAFILLPCSSAISFAEEPAAPPKQIVLVKAFIKKDAPVGISRRKDCTVNESETLHKGTKVYILGPAACGGKDLQDTPLVAVAWKGERHYINKADLVYSAEELSNADKQPAEEAKARRIYSLRQSLADRKFALVVFYNSLKAKTKKYGLAILECGPYDVSKHPEGAGYRVRYFNPTNKAIKYVTTEVLGLNASNAPVFPGISQAKKTATIRGVGPIEPGESATYSHDDIWRTDRVKSTRIQSITVDYMDGTKKEIGPVDAVKIKMPPAVLELLEEKESLPEIESITED